MNTPHLLVRRSKAIIASVAITIAINFAISYAADSGVPSSPRPSVSTFESGVPSSPRP